MAKPVDAKKRKAAPEPTSAAAKKTKLAEPLPAPKSALKKSSSRTTVKHAPTENQVTEVEKRKPTTKKSAKTTEDANADGPGEKQSQKVKKQTSNGATKVESKTNSTKADDSTKVKKTVMQNDDFAGFSDDDEVDGAKVDDQTAALLAGFESSEDENDPVDDGVKLDKIPKIPDTVDLKKQLVAAQTTDDEDTPGVLYVGRIPHGFFEHQMRDYFSQFGDITHLRLARNKLSGKSKHYAFIEFSSAAVADIVAKTMDKYLMFGHILQVRRIPKEQVHPELWKGEGRRFKAMPRNKIERGHLRRGATRERWEERIKTEQKRRNSKAKKLAEMGYEFDMPTLKSVSDVPVQERKRIAPAAVEETVIIAPEEESVKLVETTETPEEKVMTVVEETPEDGTTVTETANVKRKKGRKEPKTAKKVRLST